MRNGFVVGGVNTVMVAARDFGAGEARATNVAGRSQNWNVAAVPRWPGRRLDAKTRVCGQYSIKTVCIMTPLQPCFLRLLRLFAANQRKSLSINNLQTIANFRNQAQSRLIKAHQGILIGGLYDSKW
jgi:hypothetical protein